MPESTKAAARPTGSPVAPNTPVTAGPVAPHDRSQTLVRPEELLTSDLEPQVKDDGKVYVSDAISDRAKDEGYEPDIQPRAHPSQDLPRPTDKELEDAALEHSLAVVALDALQAPLSVKVELAKDDKDPSDVVTDAKSDIKAAVKDGDLTAPRTPDNA